MGIKNHAETLYTESEVQAMLNAERPKAYSKNQKALISGGCFALIWIVCAILIFFGSGIGFGTIECGWMFGADSFILIVGSLITYTSVK